MGVEIERRFLVTTQAWREKSASSAILRQAYLAITPAAATRVRLSSDGRGWLTIKSGAAGRVRAEFEYPIPQEDAVALLDMRTGHLIEKERFIVPAGRRKWEIDVFSGSLAPLVIAEIELESADQPVDSPAWLGVEITEDARYSNASLAIYGLPDDFMKV